MMTGRVNVNHEAMVELRVTGPVYFEAYIDAIVDTGFNGELVLPEQTITSLGLTLEGSGQARLGDGNAAIFGIYRATVEWNGAKRSVQILSASGDGAALVGMALLDGLRLTVEAWSGGTVTIEAP